MSEADDEEAADLGFPNPGGATDDASLAPADDNKKDEDPSIAIRALFDSLGPFVERLNEHQMKTLEKQHEIAQEQSAAQQAHVSAQRAVAEDALLKAHEREVSDQIGRRKLVWGVLILGAGVSVVLAFTGHINAILTVFALLTATIGMILNKSNGAPPGQPPAMD